MKTEIDRRNDFQSLQPQGLVAAARINDGGGILDYDGLQNTDGVVGGSFGIPLTGEDLQENGMSVRYVAQFKSNGEDFPTEASMLERSPDDFYFRQRSR